MVQLHETGPVEEPTGRNDVPSEKCGIHNCRNRRAVRVASGSVKTSGCVLSRPEKFLMSIASDKKSKHRHYLKNRRRYIQQAREQTALLTAIAVRLKSRPCLDCKIEYPSWVMQFDHVRGEKVADIANLVRLGSLQNLLDEISKCDVVCANCHAQRTHERRSGIGV